MTPEYFSIVSENCPLWYDFYGKEQTNSNGYLMSVYVSSSEKKKKDTKQNKTNKSLLPYVSIFMDTVD